MAQFLHPLRTKEEVDRAILNTRDKVLVLRFGRQHDLVCMRMDEILFKGEQELANMAAVYTIEAEDIPLYVSYFDITLIPATIFFFNATHMKVDYGTPDHSKFIGAFHTKQDFIDLIEVIYRGAVRGKAIVSCPIDQSHIPKYQLFYRDI